MTEAEKKHKKNMKIITIATVGLVLVIFFYNLSNCTFSGEPQFRYVYNQDTGERCSVFASIFVWAFVGVVSLILYIAIVGLCTIITHSILHRKDKGNAYLSEQEKEFLHKEEDYAFKLFTRTPSIAMFILMLLYISSIISVN